VTWKKDGAEVGSEFILTQTLTDTVLATYKHTLTSNNADIVGNFTCEVRDAAGNTDSRFRIVIREFSHLITYGTFFTLTC
jgi:hypothetical protein